ncbi:F-actin-monooxygenase mical1 [Syngnathoides biaculeatus]|uniref:F-actin-monooxygenase mical1 n=1 Tax=Syngnathoides biaculeatus TaxID=300417 RepID=UPI002ADDB85E|nr:F-actin-monooxygenase mical1 [Syngnathoides biaculeatus]XP_061684355.1 F-actin-monooxygenase mical1 [Syngnathoides biaculeatus]XP_061684363.1 F-actin-monooxygenase mical1 [Syngnathoides biaculeatus]
MASQDPVNTAHVAFDRFVQAQDCKDVQWHFDELCQQLDINLKDFENFYSKLKERLNYWRAKALWTKLDKRASHPDYQQRKACAKNKCLILGAGPCGLRTAIELSLLGARVVVLEKRESFSRNNVLHLWPFTICDLRSLGAKMFYGKFCTGSLDHISIRQLQLILFKISLLLGVEVHTGVEFRGLLEPSGEKGWAAKVLPETHPASTYQFDVFVSAGGGKFVPDGFKHKELRGKLAIGITANFVNRFTTSEAQVAEISGVARIYNQKFFQDLLTETGIDLENIVYYKDDTHYFVMTAKKRSLLKKGVIKQDFNEAEDLLAAANIDQEALLRYARDAAHFATGGKLPELEFAQNHARQPDVAVFDFTCMQRAENASLVRELRGKKLLTALVGDCLVEPFWPLGTGIARGFLAALDTAWMVRNWGLGVPPLKLLAERESIYQVLSQTTPENTCKKYATYSIDPKTRYLRVNLTSIQSSQVQHLYNVDKCNPSTKKQNNRRAYTRQDSFGSEELLKWCRKHTVGYNNVDVKDFTNSWKSGLALCALIHRFRPLLIDMSTLNASACVRNQQLAFSILEKELGIPPVMSAADFANGGQIDKLSMVLYLTQIKNAFTVPTPAPEPKGFLTSSKSLPLSRTRSAVFFLSTLKRNSLQRRKEKEAAEKVEKRENVKRMGEEDCVAPLIPHDPNPPAERLQPEPVCLPQADSESCYFCGGRVYVLERISAESKFFHRGCFTCHRCGATLRLGDYAFHQATGRFYCELHSEGLEDTPPISSLKDRKRNDAGMAVLSLSSEVYAPSPSDDEDDHTVDCLPPRMLSSARRNSKEEPPSDDDRHMCVEQSDRQPLAPASYPLPKPRLSRQTAPNPQPSPPDVKPRTVHHPIASSPKVSPPHTPVRTMPQAAPRAAPRAAPQVAPQATPPKQPLRKLKLSDEEKNQLVNLLTFPADSDSETPGGSSSCSSSSVTARGQSPPKAEDGQEEEGYWSGGAAAHVREKRNRRCFRRKEMPAGQPRVRSKFSPWNLSSPRISRDSRLSVHQPGRVETTFRQVAGASEEAVNGDEDDDDEPFKQEDFDFLDEKFQTLVANTAEAEKLELMKMRTLERRAKMSELQRLRQAQSIQRRLEEIEVTFRDLEQKGVVLEQRLQGEAQMETSPDMIESWIQLVHEKNALVSEESDLMVASRQLELEDQQSTLELELRKYVDLNDKTPEQQAEEERVLQQMIEVVDMRDSLVSFLEEKRLKELQEEQDVLSLMEAKRHSKAGPQVLWQ